MTNNKIQDVHIVAPEIPFKTAYGTNYPNTRIRFSTDPVSLTHQAQAPECDINTIMKKYEKTGILEHRNNFEGQYGDFTQTPSDYQESLNAVLEADHMFSTLPSKVRRRFGNDPSAFIDFVGDPDNLPEMVKMGLATAPDSVIEPSDPKPPKASPDPSTGPKKGEKTPE